MYLTCLPAQAATAADDSDRMRKVLESKVLQDDERTGKLEDELKEVRNKAEEADKQYDEVQKKLAQTETDLERAEERAEVAVIIHLIIINNFTMF